eukprot:TRINITY_DN5306_c0_g2_i3.p1 TRINITY_DN5306_c0_g2~~TRINITY_DN5306_c0_g2_i3.p1  ORF type:complete len:647 (+),score=148.92 TRINITY_DN5306_c0_g2_i3:117-1943(+)
MAGEKRNLRAALEKRTLALHEMFLKEFRGVIEQFDRVAADVNVLGDSCNRMQKALVTTKTESQEMVDKLAVLQSELETTKAKEDQVKAFLERFHLTPEEKQVLRGDVTPQFFTVLEKVKDIHNHCSDLLTAQHQQAGVEVMEMTYLQQSQGYEKLNKWVHAHIDEIMSQDTPEVPALFLRALTTLKERGPLWCGCVKEIAAVRKQAVVRKFFTTMTRGSGTGGRPIDAQSHDPLRYIGDMLAWVHQAVAEENDLINNFFSSSSQPAASVSSRSQYGNIAPDAVLEVSKADLMDQTFEGLVRHLKTRIAQIIESTPTNVSTNLVVFFRLESVLEFYWNIIPPLLGPSAALSVLLQDLKLQALKQFFDMLKSMSDRLLATPLQVTKELTPPPVIHEALAKLKMMMDTLAESLIPPEDREKEFAAVLSGIVDPLLTLIERVDDLDTASKNILSINCLHVILSTFGDHSFTKKKAGKVSARLHEDVASLVSLQSEILLRRSGLSDILEKIATTTSTSEPLSSFATTSPHAMEEAIQAFYKYMYTLGSSPLPLSERIVAMRMRDMVNTRTIKAVCDAYTKVYDAIMLPSNGYTNPRKMLQHTPDNVRTLLDCN